MLAVDVKNLDFDFGGPPILKNVTLALDRGSRCLLVGANGAGKSTLLNLLAGKRLSAGHINVLGKKAFYEAPVGVTYLGTEWVANPVVRTDIPVTRLLKTMGAEKYQERCSELLEVMDVNPNWHMHQVSDGERRRVQITLGLLEPWDLLLLDEVTVDLDLVVRANLLKYLIKESDSRGATIVYATHIFDGLASFPTHLAHMSSGTITKLKKMDESFTELEQERLSQLLNDSPLLRLVEKWLREDYRERRVLSEGELGKDGKPKSKWDILSENMREYGDKYFNYWN